jgi:hypothetical protein
MTLIVNDAVFTARNEVNGLCYPEAVKNKMDVEELTVHIYNAINTLL